jgi:hypothetical protein
MLGSCWRLLLTSTRIVDGGMGLILYRTYVRTYEGQVVSPALNALSKELPRKFFQKTHKRKTSNKTIRRPQCAVELMDVELLFIAY